MPAINPVPTPVEKVPPQLMTDTQIASVESALTAFAPDRDLVSATLVLEHACRSYRRMLVQQTPDNGKINLATLQRINPQAYVGVLKTLKPEQRVMMTAFVAENAGKALPVAGKAIAVSAALAAIKLK